MNEDQMVELVETADGSTTGRHLGTGATYRSVFGALTEVRHVFIESTGLPRTERTHWRVLELGFGLGTSFVETARVASELGITLDYVSVEREPVEPSFVQHEWEPGRAVAIRALEQMGGAPTAQVSEGDLQLTLLKQSWDTVELHRPVDAVYFDPFGPSVNPESWTDAAFQVAYRALEPTGRLATYSAAGHVRRALARSGFVLATRPGPGRKREITVASPQDRGLGGLERLSMTRYLKEEP